MNRKEYRLLASFIATGRSIEDDAREWIALELADTLEATYSNFNRKMFLAACQKTEK